MRTGDSGAPYERCGLRKTPQLVLRSERTLGQMSIPASTRQLFLMATAESSAGNKVVLL